MNTFYHAYLLKHENYIYALFMLRYTE